MASLTHLEAVDTFHDPVRRYEERQEMLRSQARLRSPDRDLSRLPRASNIESRFDEHSVNLPQRIAAGQQFRVGNIGQNGALHLRPVSRATPPFPTPPATPLPILSPESSDDFDPADYNWRGSLFSDPQELWSPRRRAESPTAKVDDQSQLPYHPPSQYLNSAAAYAPPTSRYGIQSEPQERFHAKPTLLPERPRKRSRTDPVDLLEVPIPHYRLGTPHFSGAGQAILHSSLYSDSSTATVRMASPAKGQLSAPLLRSSDARQSFSSDLLIPDTRTSGDYYVQREDEARPGIVRISSTTGQIMAATPSGLITQITSPSLLDYQLLSDFFLTYRAYMKPGDLVDYLVTRLRWAIERDDDFGRIVRVRTFVALRHWILNYFIDDFACDHTVRVQFCDLVNAFCNELRTRTGNGNGDLKVLDELKKCWRRTCALYWDISYHETGTALVDIQPGGLLGSRRGYVDGPMTETKSGNTPPRARFDAGVFGRAQSIPYNRDVTIPVFAAQGPSLSVPLPSHTETESEAERRSSSDSMDAVWCSIPRKALTKHRGKPGRSMGPRPVGARASIPTIHESSTQFNEMANRVEGTGGLLIDSRASDKHEALTRRSRAEDSEHSGSLVLPFPGSLIRGVVIQPITPYMEGLDVMQDHDMDVPFASLDPEHVEMAIDDDGPIPGTNPGVRKLLGPVRRALSASARKQSTSSYIGDGRYQRSGRPSLESQGHRRSDTPQLALAVPHIGKQNMSRPQLRIDLLAANISESFKQALTEDAKAQNSTEHSKTNSGPSEPRRTYHKNGSIQSIPPNMNPLKGNPVTSIDAVPTGSENRASFLRERDVAASTSGWARITSNAITTDLDVVSQEEQGIAAGAADTTNLDLQTASDTSPAAGQADRDRTMLSPTGLRVSSETHSCEELVTTNIGLDPAVSRMLNSGNVIHVMSATPEAALEPTTEQPTKSSVGAATVLSDLTAASTENPFNLEKVPARQIRRQPGGDLRAVDHVRSLVGSGQPQSVGSVDYLSPRTASGTYSVLDLNQSSPQRSIQILPTSPRRGSERTSFDLAVAKLAQLPDSDDDGGPESALRKLEGRSEEEMEEGFPDDRADTSYLQDDSMPGSRGSSIQIAQRQHRLDKKSGIDQPLASEGLVELRGSVESPERPRHASSVMSDHSYSSTPLLERDMSQPPRKRTFSTDSLAASLPSVTPQRSTQAGAEEGPMLGGSSPTLPHSGPAEHGTHAIRGGAMHGSSEGHSSFLLDDDESLRTLSTHRHEQTAGGAEYRGLSSFYNDDGGSAFCVSETMPHPLRHPETPPKGQHLLQSDSSPLVEPLRSPSPPRHVPLQARVDFHAQASAAAAKATAAIETAETNQGRPLSSTPPIAHLPFILCHSPLLLAQQFTLIERDALSEIDWRELIDLRWKQTTNDTRNWVDFLKTTSISPSDLRLRGGVDVCITRFNIMVKWAVSQIVLTQDLSERAACITRYIHIADHCKRLRNWATMFQLTMALGSGDVVRLKRTWAEVPPREQETFRTLETLITPVRNFQNLRVEMEEWAGGPLECDGLGANGGCIPFIGIYTHDLIYNAQKPAFLQKTGPEAAGTEEPLVNFERHRVAAGIVKGLLGMVEASARYEFKPVAEVLSKCLWMAALGDAEIGVRSRGLEA